MNADRNGITGKWMGLGTPFSDISKLEAGILGFDRMQEVEVFHSDSKELTEKYKGIYNLNQKRLEAIVSDEYKLLQHTDAFLPIITILKKFNMTKIHGHFGCIGNKANVVINFDDERLNLKIKDEMIQLSLYLKHGVDGTLALWGTLGAFRLVCSNGMIVGEFLGQERQIHIGEDATAERIPKFFESLIQQGIANNKILSNIIELSMTEIIKDKVLEAFLMGAELGKRYVKEILIKCRRLDIKNRWNIYNAVTEFITHEMARASFNSRLMYLKKANKILVGDANGLIESGRKFLQNEKEGVVLETH